MSIIIIQLYSNAHPVTVDVLNALMDNKIHALLAHSIIIFSTVLAAQIVQKECLKTWTQELVNIVMELVNHVGVHIFIVA